MGSSIVIKYKTLGFLVIYKSLSARFS